MPSPSLHKFSTTIEAYRTKLADESASVRDLKALDEVRNQFLSRKRGYVTLLFEEMKTLPAEDRPAGGQLIIALKSEVQDRLAALEARLKVPAKVRPDLSTLVEVYKGAAAVDAQLAAEKAKAEAKAKAAAEAKAKTAPTQPVTPA